MSLGAFIDQREALAGIAPVQRDPSDFMELTKLKYKETVANYQTTSRQDLMRESTFQSLSSNDAKVQELYGKKITHKDSDNWSDKKYRGRRNETVERQKRLKLKYEAIEKLKASDPEKYKDVKTYNEVLRDAKEKAREKARQTQIDFSEAALRSDGATLAGLVGGIGGAATDPLNVAVTAISLAAAPFTGGGSLAASGATTGRMLLRVFLREAALNAAAEAVVQPSIASWQKEIGNEYGFTDAIENIGLAAIFGGTIGVVGKGARPSASAVFKRIGDIERLPVSVRTAAKYMHRIAHVNESVPNPTKTLDDIGRHLEDAGDAVKAIEEGRSVKPKITEKEFNSLDTEIKPTDTEVQKTHKLEMQKHQDPQKRFTPEELEELKPKYDLETMPQQVLEKASEKKGTLLAKDLAPEELEMLKSAGIEPNKRGQIKKQDLVKELKRREKSGDKIDAKDRTSHIKAHKQAIKDKIAESQKSAPKENLVDAPELTIEKVVEHSKLSETPEVKMAESKAFEDILTKDPNMKIHLDEGTMTIKELFEEFGSEEKYLKEILDCRLA